MSPNRPGAHLSRADAMFSQLSGLEGVGFNDLINDDLIPDGYGQVMSGSSSLAHTVALKTEEQALEREQNERQVLDSVGDYKCPSGMSVEHVPVIANIKTLP